MAEEVTLESLARQIHRVLAKLDSLHANMDNLQHISDRTQQHFGVVRHPTTYISGDEVSAIYRQISELRGRQNALEVKVETLERKMREEVQT